MINYCVLNNNLYGSTNLFEIGCKLCQTIHRILKTVTDVRIYFAKVDVTIYH